VLRVRCALGGPALGFLAHLRAHAPPRRSPPWGLATAALLCHRFFSRKSMKRNDRFVIAAASLHLAAKIQESPKPIRDVGCAM
jgi:hypothetical protein